MLREPIATRRRRIAGHAAVAILASAAAFAAWAAQPASGSQDSSAGQPATRTGVHPGGALDESRMPPPKYPKEVLDAGLGGTVNLIVDLAADGRITGVSVENAATIDPRLASAAARSAWGWKFKPPVKDGEPIAGRVRVPVTFSPEKPKKPEQG